MARILVIEDSSDSRMLMSYLLDASGHVTVCAAGGEAGIELALREAPDLIVCDINMPKMDGYEVARQIKRNPALSSIPLVAVTSLAMVGDRDKVLAAGFDGYLAKPIVSKRFVEQLESYLHAFKHPPIPIPAPIAASQPPQQESPDGEHPGR